MELKKLEEIYKTPNKEDRMQIENKREEKQKEKKKTNVKKNMRTRTK